VPALYGVSRGVSTPSPWALWVERPTRIEKKSRASTPRMAKAIAIDSRVRPPPGPTCAQAALNEPVCRPTRASGMTVVTIRAPVRSTIVRSTAAR